MWYVLLISFPAYWGKITRYVRRQDFRHHTGSVQPFRQFTMVTVRCRKSVTLQLVMPRELLSDHGSEVRLFKNMCRSVYIAPTELLLDLKSFVIIRIVVFLIHDHSCVDPFSC